jgi:hypothetical protein
MLNEIEDLKKIRAEIAVLRGREKELAKPALEDLSLLPALYERFREILSGMSLPPDPDSVGQRKQFILVSMILYSPEVFCGKRTKNGLCEELARMFGVTKENISRNISDALFFYENYQDYRDSVEAIYEKIVSRLNNSL